MHSVHFIKDHVHHVVYHLVAPYVPDELSWDRFFQGVWIHRMRAAVEGEIKDRALRKSHTG